MRKLSEYYTDEVVNSYFHLYGRGYHQDRVDIDVLAAGSEDVVSRWWLSCLKCGMLWLKHIVTSYVMDLRVVYYFVVFYVARIACDMCIYKAIFLVYN
jgi:hypothetical protein